MTRHHTPTDAERIAELEYQVSELSRENGDLRGRAGQRARADSEIEKHRKRCGTETTIEAVRQMLRTPYVHDKLPTVHRILNRLNTGTAPKDAANWLDLADATDELERAQAEALANAEHIRDALEKVSTASRHDRQEWIDNASDDLRKLWHLGGTP